MTSSKYPIVSWDTGIRHEALRVLFYLKRLPGQELQNHGFLVLPHATTKDSRRTIVMPNIRYTPTIKLIATTPMTAPEHTINEVIDLLTPFYQEPSPGRIQLRWQSIEKPFFDSLFHFLPKYQNIIKRINIIITNCGTISQFNIVKPPQDKLTIYLRLDAHNIDIAQVIILSLIRHQLETIEKRSWVEIETVSDFILHHTTIAIEKSHSTMMTQLQQQQTGRLVKQSQKYQASIGIPIQNNWQVVDGQPNYNHQQIPHLTSRQIQLLNLLINRQGQVVTNDQIAELLWPSGENFSLWAIVKEIARIRTCIKNANLPGSILQSHRKIGYSLV